MELVGGTSPVEWRKSGRDVWVTDLRAVNGHDDGTDNESDSDILMPGWVPSQGTTGVR